MNEASSTVTESLSVDTSEQPSERKTKTILWVAAVLLLLGGVASVIFKSNHEESSPAPTFVEQSTVPLPPAQPASAARTGKDFGF